MRDTWCNPDSQASMSILLASTYSILSDAAVATNHSINLGETKKIKSRSHPKVVESEKFLLSVHKSFVKMCSSSSPNPDSLVSSREAITQARANYRHTIRQEQICDDTAIDEELSSLLSQGQPAAVGCPKIPLFLF